MVCAQLGARSELLSSLASSADPLCSFNLTELDKLGVVRSHCVHHDTAEQAKCVIIINKANGSRTIIYAVNNNCQEVSVEDFDKIDLNSGHYDWIHFEGCKNAANISQMLHLIAEHNSKVDVDRRIGTSFEIEIPYPNVESLLSCPANIVFVSSDYAKLHGATSMQHAVRLFADKVVPGASTVCTWGEQGAAVCEPSPEADDRFKVTSVAAFPPSEVVDTIGAGDTFLGSTLFGVASGLPLATAAEFGCRVAGAKCGQMGYSGLDRMKSVWDIHYSSTVSQA